MPFKPERRAPELPARGCTARGMAPAEPHRQFLGFRRGGRIPFHSTRFGRIWPAIPQVRLSAFPRVHILSTFLPCVLAALKTGKEITLFGIKVFHDLPGPSCPEFSGRRWRKLENRELQG